MLNALALGLEWFNIDNDYNDVAIDPADLPTIRHEIETRKAQALIDHLHTNGLIVVQGTGLATPSGGGAVAGVAYGEIQ